VTRLASRLDDPRHLPLALALLFALPGVPTVYYGDEFALRGVTEDRAGGDDAVRPPLPGSDAPPGPEAAAIADLHRLLIGVRRRHPWLVDATIEPPDLLTNDVLAVRLTAGEEALGVVLNVGDTPADVALPMVVGQVVAGEATVRDAIVQVPPHGFALVAAGG
jgi:cyclomaltodextrinase / maltogenic alpha-amylase / neopullulanase